MKLSRVLRGAVNLGSIVPGPWTPFARAASVGLSLSDALRKRRQQASGGGGGLDEQYAGAIAEERGGPTGAGYKGLTEFDPSAAFEKYGEAAQGRFTDLLKRGLGDLTGSAVGQGRLDTGFYNEDVGDLASRMGREYRQDLHSAALQTAGMTQQKFGQMAAIEDASRNRYLDLLSGGMDRAQARENVRSAGRAGTRNAIIGGLAEIGSTIFGRRFGGAGGGARPAAPAPTFATSGIAAPRQRRLSVDLGVR